MIIKLDHYRKSNSRAIVDSYYSQEPVGNSAPKRDPAKILHAPLRALPRQPENVEGITTPEDAGT